MIFRKIQFDKNETDKVGLKEISLIDKPLGNVVALVGQNGAGKTRVLNLVKDYINHLNGRAIWHRYIDELPREIQNDYFFLFQQELKQPGNLYERKITNAQNFLTANRAILSKHVKFINSDDIKKVKGSLKNNLTFENIIKNNFTKDGAINEFQDFFTPDAFTFLKNRANTILKNRFRLFLKYNKDLGRINKEIEANEDNILFNVFQKYIQLFLGSEFSFDTEDNDDNELRSILMLDGAKFDIENLSPGQKILFSYAIFFFYLEVSTSTHIEESVIIIDEPELHLHPIAQIKLIDALRKIVENRGQLWIATHSIHILSHLNYDEIFMVKNGKIHTPNRTMPGNTLLELMGVDENVNHLNSFISSTSDWAYANFMTQCLKSPEVIFNIDTKDPQYILFKNFIIASEINLLDFGAGKGRLGYTINEDDKLSQRVNYFAFEPSLEFKESLLAVPNIRTVISDVNELGGYKFDVVLLCNVLHEIHPKEWLSVIENIRFILNYSGYLIIIEDNNLPKGERANDYGYLILNNRQIKTLFGGRELLELDKLSEKYEGRFSFCAIPRENMFVSKESVVQAISELNSSTYQAIKTMTLEGDVAKGRMYANLTQLYINSTIALEDMLR